MTGVEENDPEVRWTPEVGALLKRARGVMSKREAARRAGFSESTWRALELGVRRPAKGIEVPVNPTVGNLASAADAVGLPVSQVMELVGVTWDDDADDPRPGEPDRLRAVEQRLDELELSMANLQRLIGGTLAGTTKAKLLELVEGVVSDAPGEDEPDEEGADLVDFFDRNLSGLPAAAHDGDSTAPRGRRVNRPQPEPEPEDAP